jgi:tetrapyrrole methylase family protein/MazG family protein
MPTTDYNKHFTELYDLIKQLRGPNGCPWDKKQTPESIKKYLIEEVEELAEAVSHKSSQHVCEEIGDLLFILMMIIRIYEEDNNFTITDVISGISKKMIRRHPHVFAGKKTGTDDELKEQWEAIKAQENNKT